MPSAQPCCAQVCVLAQLLLDPHYRTFDGFLALLDKDILSFGHKCSERLGYSTEGHSSAEWSPVLLQLFDAVHQIMSQAAIVET